MATALDFWKPKLALLLALTALHGLSADSISIVDEIQANLARALELRQTRAKEVDNWKSLKPQLDSMISLRRLDNESLADQISELESVIKSYAERLASAEAEVAENQTVLESSLTRFQELDSNLETLISILPVRLRERGTYLLEQARESATPNNTVAIRRGMEVYLEFLTEVILFDRETQSYSQIRVLPDGRKAEFTVIHIGLGATFFLSDELEKAGRIRLNNSEWVWEENPKLLDDLRLTKRILDGEADPQFVALPMALNVEAAQ